MKAYVKNAADIQQVREAEKKIKFNRRQELDDIKFLLSTIQGRRFFWRLMSHCRVFESIWHPSALIHHNSGVQDVGHFIQAEIIESDPDAYVRMMTENQKSNGGSLEEENKGGNHG